jgi:endogenous inhibitor of DNA gyrase (YacG/DUF329 family)
MRKRCEVCGREFEAKRSTARFCSAACRQVHYRAQATGRPRRPKLPVLTATERDVLAAARDAHRAAGDLSRLSLLVGPELGGRLSKAAAGIEDSMREAGL